ncbi:hypothetical protein OHS18_47490 [Amycolatopsis sp. NBC_00355]|uniref:hypothetical protein n=1 Tax=Amycolatopsis sp. NBC_00355 TaxID=2975957 RepID=UPI002E2663DB
MTATAPAALTSEQIGALAHAVSRAPSVHNSQPWQLLVHGTEVDLLERRDVALRRHDPFGRDRLLSCGAALTNLAVSARDFALYHAIGRRRSHRHAFFPGRVPPASAPRWSRPGRRPGARGGARAPGQARRAARLRPPACSAKTAATSGSRRCGRLTRA